MAVQAYIHLGGSHDRMSGGSGGWVAVCGGAILYGNAYWPGAAGIAEADRAAAMHGIRDVLDAFPEADEILISTNSNEVETLPWGFVAEGVDEGVDRTGLLAFLRERGVRHAVRWHPHRSPVADAAGVMMHAASALASQAKRGERISGRMPLAPGWRSALVAVVGRSAMNHSLRVEGLTWDEAAAVVGQDVGQIKDLVASRRLRTTPEGFVTYASALNVRDENLEGDELQEDYGQAHLAACAVAPAARIFVDLQVWDGVVAIGIARAKSQDTKVLGQATRVGDRANIDRNAAAVAIDQLRHRLSDLSMPGAVDVVTTDTWLTKLLGGLLPPPSTTLATALGNMRQALTERNLFLRLHFVKERVAVAGRGAPAMDMMMAALTAARIAAVKTPFIEKVPTEDGAPALLLRKVEAAAATAREAYLPGRQSMVAKELFRHAPGEDGAMGRFEALACETFATYAGNGVALPAILPGPIDGGVAMLGEDGVHTLMRSFAIHEDLSARWVAWWREYEGILERHPILALRDALLRLDGQLRMSSWPRIKHEKALQWYEGTGAKCPFKMRGTDPERLRGLIRDCGGWPFPPPPASVPRGKGR